MRVLRTFLISVIVVATVCLLLITPPDQIRRVVMGETDEAGATTL